MRRRIQDTAEEEEDDMGFGLTFDDEEQLATALPPRRRRSRSRDREKSAPQGRVRLLKKVKDTVSSGSEEPATGTARLPHGRHVLSSDRASSGSQESPTPERESFFASTSKKVHGGPAPKEQVRETKERQKASLPQTYSNCMFLSEKPRGAVRHRKVVRDDGVEATSLDFDRAATANLTERDDLSMLTERGTELSPDMMEVESSSLEPMVQMSFARNKSTYPFMASAQHQLQNQLQQHPLNQLQHQLPHQQQQQQLQHQQQQQQRQQLTSASMAFLRGSSLLGAPKAGFRQSMSFGGSAGSLLSTAAKPPAGESGFGAPMPVGSGGLFGQCKPISFAGEPAAPANQPGFGAPMPDGDSAGFSFGAAAKPPASQSLFGQASAVPASVSGFGASMPDGVPTLAVFGQGAPRPDGGSAGFSFGAAAKPPASQSLVAAQMHGSSAQSNLGFADPTFGFGAPKPHEIPEGLIFPPPPLLKPPPPPPQARQIPHPPPPTMAALKASTPAPPRPPRSGGLEQCWQSRSAQIVCQSSLAAKLPQRRSNLRQPIRIAMKELLQEKEERPQMLTTAPDAFFDPESNMQELLQQEEEEPLLRPAAPFKKSKKKKRSSVVHEMEAVSRWESKEEFLLRKQGIEEQQRRVDELEQHVDYGGETGLKETNCRLLDLDEWKNAVKDNLEALVLMLKVTFLNSCCQLNDNLQELLWFDVDKCKQMMIAGGLKSLGLTATKELEKLVATLLVVLSVVLTSNAKYSWSSDEEHVREATQLLRKLLNRKENLALLESSGLPLEFHDPIDSAMKWCREFDARHPLACCTMELASDWPAFCCKVLGLAC
ncbi:hypothetical protein V1264_016294 [Littorina saxatilis]|uniref:Uncharacterized protein n=1 Tax=Littorina saxatilis TaxID=31220 RepID=A0AAN9BM55_9CAEN